MSSQPLRENKTVSFSVVPSRFCPRKLKPGQVKRYMSKGPLFGYMIACPGCHFIELHEHATALFVEAEETLTHAMGSLSCMNCKARLLVTTGGWLVADYTGLDTRS